MNWRPIETAPKDGRQIIVMDPRQDCARVVSWMTPMEGGDGTWVYARKLSCEEPLIGEAIAFHVSEPTHWMPLPDPPTPG